MINLYSFGATFGVVDPSPFVGKIDLYLKLAKLEFKSVAKSSNLQKAPKGKLPFITDNGQTIADSHFIISYLEKQYDVDLDTHLDAEQKGISCLVGKSLDESLYWCLVYSRWVAEDTWPKVKEAFFSTMPFPLKIIVPIVARKSVVSALQKQGFGRHSEQEILSITEHSLQSLSAMLGDKTYFFGEQISSFDATAYSLLSQFISVPFDNKFNALAKNYDNLVQYCKNIETIYYPDL